MAAEFSGSAFPRRAPYSRYGREAPRRPRDLNQWAKRMVDIATGEVDDREPAPQTDPNKDPSAVALGRKGGLKGGRARADSLTSAEQKKIAQEAAKKHWQKD
jgi:hypothetical protein